MPFVDPSINEETLEFLLLSRQPFRRTCEWELLVQQIPDSLCAVCRHLEHAVLDDDAEADKDGPRGNKQQVGGHVGP